MIFFVEDRTYQQDVGKVGGTPLHHVWVIEGDDVAVLQILDGVGGVLQHGLHGAPELAYDHTALAVRYEGELVGLFPDHGAYGGGDEYPVHLVADVFEGILDDVEGNVVYVVFPDEIRLGLFVQHHLLCLLDQDVPEAVNGAPVARLNDRSRIVLHDDGGTGYSVSRTQLGAVVDRGLLPSAVEVQLLFARDRVRRVLSGPVFALQEADALYGAATHDADGGDLQRRVWQVEVVALAVGLLEPSAQEGAAPILEFLELEAAGNLDVLQVVAAVRIKVEPLFVLFHP